MKHLLVLFCFLLSYWSSGQDMVSYACVNKALSLKDAYLSGVSMSEIEGYMCNCPVFAKGKDLIVYSDEMGPTFARIIFMFNDGKCNGTILKVHFNNRSIVDDLMEHMSLMYEEQQLIYAPYGSASVPSVMWFGEKTHVHMAEWNQLVEFKKTYGE